MKRASRRRSGIYSKDKATRPRTRRTRKRRTHKPEAPAKEIRAPSLAPQACGEARDPGPSLAPPACGGFVRAAVITGFAGDRKVSPRESAGMATAFPIEPGPRIVTVPADHIVVMDNHDRAYPVWR